MDIKIGQSWYVKLPGKKSLNQVSIEELTDHTVVVNSDDELSIFGIYATKTRYKITDIEWVEQLT